jgi:uncharacterized protein YydD (DUF2326 family)
MFLKSLTISNNIKTIRHIQFHKGVNLIIDKTPPSDKKSTGNNVGKTTVLKLIDFCLGANPQIIYSDTEHKKETYGLIKDFLYDNNILITLILKEDLENELSKEVIIERNFAQRTGIIRRVNGVDLKEKDFDPYLLDLFFPYRTSDRPTFKQIVSHNVRYKDEQINQTLKTLDRYTSDVEYETLHLFLLGCNFENGNEKQALITKLNQETTYKERLEKDRNKNAYEALLNLVNSDIEKLQIKKNSFSINENFESDLEELNEIKIKINKVSGNLSNLSIRHDLIIESQNDLENSLSNIDLRQLRMIYEQATKSISNIQNTFEELVQYHNRMIREKQKFISRDLPVVESKMENEAQILNGLLKEEATLVAKISKSDSFDALELLISELNELFRQKGEYENIIAQINDAETNIADYEEKLGNISDKLFSDSFNQIIRNQVNKFNKFFTEVSDALYGEKYLLSYKSEINKKNGQKVYKFNTFNANLSSGKKQGEILCFDIAYILFADSEKMPCVHFLLNDKKELMHAHQLLNVNKYIEDKNIQLVVSILEDKLPEELKSDKKIVLRLSQTDKLFRI